MNPDRRMRMNTNKWVEETRLSLHVGPTSWYCKSHWVNWPHHLVLCKLYKQFRLPFQTVSLFLCHGNEAQSGAKLCRSKIGSCEHNLQLERWKLSNTSSCYKLLLQIASYVRAFIVPKWELAYSLRNSTDAQKLSNYSDGSVDLSAKHRYLKTFTCTE